MASEKQSAKRVELRRLRDTAWDEYDSLSRNCSKELREEARRTIERIALKVLMNTED